MIINPLSPNVLVVLETVKSETKFIVAEVDKEKQGYGIIKEIFPLCKRVKVGDQVFFKKYKPEKMVTPDGAQFYLVDENDILAIYT